jgi:uncharacterized membrane protein
MVIALLSLGGVFLAAYLALYKLGYIGSIACGTGGCETVAASKWALFLGIPVAVWGVGFYLSMLAVAFLGTLERWADSRGPSVALVALSGWGVIYSTWLTYLELAEIHAICRFCVVSACLVLVLFVLSVRDLREERAPT